MLDQILAKGASGLMMGSPKIDRGDLRAPTRHFYPSA